jgi:hypothetical protein
MKYIKRLNEFEEILNKDKSNVYKLAFYDFDGTIIDSPMPELGKLLWAKAKGIVYPHKGWWSKPESLDLDIFNIEKIKETDQRIKRDLDNKYCWVVLLTNRISKLKPEVSRVLRHVDVEVDEFQMMDKINYSKSIRIKNVIQDFPQVTQIDIYDDDDKNLSDFLELKSELLQQGISVTIYKVNSNDTKKVIRIID